MMPKWWLSREGERCEYRLFFSCFPALLCWSDQLSEQYDQYLLPLIECLCNNVVSSEFLDSISKFCLGQHCLRERVMDWSCVSLSDWTGMIDCWWNVYGSHHCVSPGWWNSLFVNQLIDPELESGTLKSNCSSSKGVTAHWEVHPQI